MRRNTLRSNNSIKLNEDADHIYFNINIHNPSNASENLLANFKENRSQIIVDNPSEYTLSVIRFSLSKTNIPIFYANVFPKDSLSAFPWIITNTYVLNQATNYLGQNYISLIANNLGNQPNISPATWRFVPVFVIEWSGTTTYNINDGVTVNNVVYVSLVNGNISNPPATSPVQWGRSQVAPFLSNPAPNYTRYTVGLSFGAQTITETIIYETVDLSALPPQDWTVVTPENAAYYAVFMFSEFIAMINKAYKAAYNRLNPLSPPKLAGAPAPYLLYNPETLIVALVAHKSFDENFVQGPTASIYMNTSLMSFFRDALQYDQFFSYNGNNGLDYKLSVDSRGDNIATLIFPDVNYPTWQNTLNYEIGQGVFYLGVNYVSLTLNFNKPPNLNPGDWAVQAQTPIPQSYSKTAAYVIGQVVFYQGFYYVNTTGANTGPPNGVDWNSYLGFDMCVMKGDYANLYNWVDIQSILFVSNLVPIVDEFVPAGRQNPNSATLSQTTSNPTLQIITDFIPDVQTGVDINSNIVFFNLGEYRLANLVSDTPLRSINIQIFYTDVNNQLFPLYLQPSGSATCKLMFRRKHIKNGLGEN